MTSSSWIVYTAIGLLPFLPPLSEMQPSLQLRALVTRIDQPEVLQHLRLAVGLDLGQVDREWRVVLFIHLNGPARPLKDYRGQRLKNGIGLRGAHLFDSHGVRVHTVVLL